MNAFSKEIITKLQDVRRTTFSTYDEITLDSEALKIFARLFVNPDCQTDIDLFAVSDQSRKLSYLGDHIITAAPSTIAKFAERKKLTHISDTNLLQCFALDHAHDVHDNHVAEEKNAMYALAHILLPSRVTSLTNIEDAITASLTFRTKWGSIIFKHVVVPHDMTVIVGDTVYHHFGVIVAHARDKKFSDDLIKAQDKLEFIHMLGRETAQKKITVDFSDAALFKKNVLELMLKPHKSKTVTNAGDLKNKKITFKN